MLTCGVQEFAFLSCRLAYFIASVTKDQLARLRRRLKPSKYLFQKNVRTLRYAFG
jgi:thiosulfate reductase cytochrome b subunit